LDALEERVRKLEKQQLILREKEEKRYGK